MDLETVYKTAVEIGISRDLRGPQEMKKILETEQAEFKKLTGEDIESYDTDRLFNPYADSRILFGAPDIEVKKVMVGIDMDVAEILLAHTLNKDFGRAVDLVIAHHPSGRALARLFDVMHLQSDLLAACGVNVSVAEQLMEKRIGEIERRLLPANHTRAVDAARLLGIPLMCLHTVADNCVTSYLTGLFETKLPERLKDLLALLKTIPEYKKAARLTAGPKIVSGTESNRCGKIFVDMTGGTEGSKDIYAQHAASGVSTIVGMHLSEEALECAKKASLNIVIAGHISSDTLGLNLMFDELEKKEPLEFVAASGFERIRAAQRPG